MYTVHAHICHSPVHVCFYIPLTLAHLQGMEQNWKHGHHTLKRIQCNSENSKGVYCLQYDDHKIVSGLRDNTIKVCLSLVLNLRKHEYKHTYVHMCIHVFCACSSWISATTSTSPAAPLCLPPLSLLSPLTLHLCRCGTGSRSSAPKCSRATLALCFVYSTMSK